MRTISFQGHPAVTHNHSFTARPVYSKIPQAALQATGSDTVQFGGNKERAIGFLAGLAFTLAIGGGAAVLTPPKTDSTYSQSPSTSHSPSSTPSPDTLTLDCAAKAPGIAIPTKDDTVQMIWSHPQTGLFCVEVDAAQRELLFDSKFRSQIINEVLPQAAEQLRRETGQTMQKEPLPRVSITNPENQVSPDERNKVRVTQKTVDGRQAAEVTLYAKNPSNGLLRYQITAAIGKK
jgi:hypothetical protein